MYKLVEIARDGEVLPIMKSSPGKPTLPGRKQVWRSLTGATAAEDFLGLADEPGTPRRRRLLNRVMVDGRRETPTTPLATLHERCRHSLDELPAAVRRLRDPERYPVRFTGALRSVYDRLSGS